MKFIFQSYNLKLNSESVGFINVKRGLYFKYMTIISINFIILN